MAVLPKQHPHKKRYTITVNDETFNCNTLDDAIETIEKGAGYDIDAVFSEGDTFEIYDTKQNVVVATNESITHLAVELNEYESSMLYTYLREYMGDFE